MKIFKIIIVCGIIFSLITACSNYIQVQNDLKPKSFNLLFEIKLSHQIDKVAFLHPNFVYLNKENSVYIYEQGELINSFGSFGFSENNFNKIDDIKISPERNLLILDSIQKKIKKFDKFGKWIATVELQNVSEPKLFDISTDRTLYIYDKNRNEVIVTKDGIEEMFSFGKFEFSNPVQFDMIAKNIFVYDKELNKTLTFDKYGQFLQEYSGYVQSNGKSIFRLEKNFVTSSDKKFMIHYPQWNTFFIKNNYCILTSNHKIAVNKIIYER